AVRDEQSATLGLPPPEPSSPPSLCGSPPAHTTHDGSRGRGNEEKRRCRTASRSRCPEQPPENCKPNRGPLRRQSAESPRLDRKPAALALDQLGRTGRLRSERTCSCWQWGR